MANWPAIETALGGWVTSITGLPVTWRHRPQVTIFSNDGYALLEITARRTVGRDDLQYEQSGTSMRVYQSGQRTFTFSVQFRTSRTSTLFAASHYTMLLRDVVRLPVTSVAVFQSVEVACARILSETDLSEDLDGDELSIAQIDFSFNASSITEDTATTYIETVTDAELEIPDGTTVWTGDLPVG